MFVIKPVVGVDVSKNFSVASAFLERHKPFESSITFQHTNDGFSEFINLLKRLEAESDQKPHIILEPTGHYHLSLMDLLQKNEYEVVLINPLVSKKERYTSLRRVKTDLTDAQQLGELYYKLELSPISFNTDELTKIRYSTRLLSYLANEVIVLKVKAKTILDITFPFYTEVFNDTFSKISLMVLNEFPTFKMVINTERNDILDFICKCYGIKNKDSKKAVSKTDKLIETAFKCPFEMDIYDNHIHTLFIVLNLIETYQKQQQFILDYIIESLSHRQDFNILKSIPGIGDNLAATILSEIGDIYKFDSHKKLIAFAGIEPSVYQSGKFKATHNKISKRGSHYLRRALYITVSGQLRGSSKCLEIRRYYDQKRAENKPYNLVMVACMNKLLRIIYALLTKKTYYNYN